MSTMGTRLDISRDFKELPCFVLGFFIFLFFLTYLFIYFNFMFFFSWVSLMNMNLLITYRTINCN